MDRYKAVGIKDLKNNLSAYLREVKAGFRILVSDRGHVVAELNRPFAGSTSPSPNPLLDEWIRDGKVRMPTVKRRRHGELLRSPVSFPDGTALRLLDEDRGE